jgi:hypothetical protein
MADTCVDPSKILQAPVSVFVFALKGLTVSFSLDKVSFVFFYFLVGRFCLLSTLKRTVLKAVFDPPSMLMCFSSD